MKFDFVVKVMRVILTYTRRPTANNTVHWKLPATKRARNQPPKQADKSKQQWGAKVLCLVNLFSANQFLANSRTHSVAFGGSVGGCCLLFVG